ncbi:ABC transporter substrate-binding protein [Calidifontibacillus erzurumensis]|uniref:ABC transporter substrate-binding protein n=1 Tax=Calidifontibacillus erzurumensis TaxID=2741433 RepID=UPI0035B505D5
MNIMKKKIVVLGTALSLTVGLVGCGQSATETTSTSNQAESQQQTENNEQTLVDFAIGHLPTTGHSLYYIAKEEGFFEEEGLNAIFHPFSNSGEGITAVTAGKLDVGTFGTPAPLTFEEKGAKIVFLGGQMGTGAGVVSKPDLAEDLRDIQNFKGKKIATVKLATGDVVLRGALYDAGIDYEKDLKIIEMNSPADVIVAVKKGEVDAGVVWAPFVEKAKQEGLEIVKYSQEYYENHVCCRIIADETRFDENYTNYVKFLKAIIKAERFEKDEKNKEKVIADIKKYVDVDPQIIEKDIYGGYVDQSADPNKKAILQMRDTMVDIGYLKDDKDISPSIRTEAYKEALDQLLNEEPNDPFYQSLLKRFEENNL